MSPLPGPPMSSLDGPQVQYRDIDWLLIIARISLIRSDRKIGGNMSANALLASGAFEYARLSGGRVVQRRLFTIWNRSSCEGIYLGTGQDEDVHRHQSLWNCLRYCSKNAGGVS